MNAVARYKILVFFLLFLYGSNLSRSSFQLPFDEWFISLKQRVTKDIPELSILPGDIVAIMEKIKADGSWPDIDYAYKTRGGQPLIQHLERLNSMAVLYKPTRWLDSGSTG